MAAVGTEHGVPERVVTLAASPAVRQNQVLAALPACVGRLEVTVVVGPPGEAAPMSERELDGLIVQALDDGSVRDAAARVAAETGIARRDIYARALKLAQK